MPRVTNTRHDHAYTPEVIAGWMDRWRSGVKVQQIARDESLSLGYVLDDRVVRRKLQAHYPDEFRLVSEVKPVKARPSPAAPPTAHVVQSQVKEAGHPVTWGALLALTPSLSDLAEIPFLEAQRHVAPTR